MSWRVADLPGATCPSIWRLTKQRRSTIRSDNAHIPTYTGHQEWIISAPDSSMNARSYLSIKKIIDRNNKKSSDLFALANNGRMGEWFSVKK
jgi:hypothetical protein